MAKHAGDLGNILANYNGVADVDIFIPSGTSLFGDDAISIFGRSIVIHQKEDDGSVPKHGNAGRIIACGVVNQNSRGTFVASMAKPKSESTQNPLHPETNKQTSSVMPAPTQSTTEEYDDYVLPY